MKQIPRGAAATLVLVTIVVAGYAGVRRYNAMRREALPPGPRAASDPIRVPLWLLPEQVRHMSRFASVWDGPAPLAAFRHAENLDAVVRGAGSDEERARKLMHWTRSQFEPGKPSPYPPPDAPTTLSEIRAGRTGGFCAQYAFVLVQALQSFGTPARLVTIEDHEVVEAWLDDAARWTMLDPLFELQVVDQGGRSLSAIDIREAHAAGATLALTAPNRLVEPLDRYVSRYDRIAVWSRNAFVSAPVNFADFDRYRVWLVLRNEPSPQPESLSTSHPEELYGAPQGFPK